MKTHVWKTRTASAGARKRRNAGLSKVVLQYDPAIEYMKQTEAAHFLGVPISFVNKMVKQGRLPTVKGPTNYTRAMIPTSSVLAYRDQRIKSAAKSAAWNNIWDKD